MKSFNSLRPIPNRRNFADDIFKCIFENENEWISPKISMKFVPNVQINDIPALVQIMAWRRPGDKPLSEPMMVSLLTHICVTRPQWGKPWCQLDFFTVEILSQPTMVSKHSLMDRWGQNLFLFGQNQSKARQRRDYPITAAITNNSIISCYQCSKWYSTGWSYVSITKFIKTLYIQVILFASQRILTKECLMICDSRVFIKLGVIENSALISRGCIVKQSGRASFRKS